VIFAAARSSLFGLGGLGERGEAAQSQNPPTLAAMAVEQRIGAVGGGRSVCATCGGREALEPTDALDLASCFSTRSSSDLFPVAQLLGLPCSLFGLLLPTPMRRGELAALVATSVNSRALRIASTAWFGEVRISPIRPGGNSPAARRNITSAPSTPA